MDEIDGGLEDDGLLGLDDEEDDFEWRRCCDTSVVLGNLLFGLPTPGHCGREEEPLISSRRLFPFPWSLNLAFTATSGGRAPGSTLGVRASAFLSSVVGALARGVPLLITIVANDGLPS